MSLIVKPNRGQKPRDDDLIHPKRVCNYSLNKIDFNTKTKICQAFLNMDIDKKEKICYTLGEVIKMTYEEIKKNDAINAYIRKADESLVALGYTEHSFAHVTKVAATAAYILETLSYPERDIELVKIAGYLHDIGNLINRTEHAQSGAVMAFRILDNLNFPPEEIATIATAIGNHDEGTAQPVNHIAAALILADKTDVRRSRVRNNDKTGFDIHDRVNYSVTRSDVIIDTEKKAIRLELEIETKYSSVMSYFEIFLGRMLLCKKAAERLGLKFVLQINGQRIG